VTINKNYIAGSWALGSAKIENVNPSDTREVIGIFEQGCSNDIDLAATAGREAQKLWQKVGMERRQSVLDSIGRELIMRSTELGELISKEQGKPRSEGIGEVYRSGQFFTWFAAEVLRQKGEIIDSVRAGVEIAVRRDPIGVVGIITPWNFPMAAASWKIAPALAFGNAVVWKPANQTLATAIALSQIISKQEIPTGLFNLVMGTGSEVGRSIAQHAGISGITFTGSVDVGRDVALTAIPTLKRLQLEMGSKNPLVIMQDADIALAADAAVFSAFSGGGQKCTAASRLIVQDVVHDEFIDALLTRMKKIRIGHALHIDTTMGPVVSAQNLNSNQRYLKIAKDEGCELAWGGELLERETPGHYMAPALLLNGKNDMQINREEIFGPITCVIRAESYDHALAMANDTDFGLTAGIFTRSLSLATHFQHHAEAGCVMVNLPTAGTDYHVPFGGRKNSGFGPREQGSYAVDFYTHVKTSYVCSRDPNELEIRQ